MHVRTSRLGPKFSEGARQLWLRAHARGLDLTSVSKKVGTDKGTLCRWLHGDHLPGADARMRIHKAFSIAIGLWSSPPRKPFAPTDVDTVATTSTARNGSA